MDSAADTGPTASRRRSYRVIEQHLDAPQLPGNVIVLADAHDVIDRLAADLVAHAEQCVRDFEEFHLALSGGSTPEPLYERLMYDPDFRRLPWQRTHLWIVDERCVPLEHELSNFRMIREIIVDHADIPHEQVHPIAATEPDADRKYENAIKQAMLYRPSGEDRLDFALLGMGTDGHTASLFPAGDALHEQHRLVRRVHHDAVDPPDRITMTYNLINAARRIAVLVTGSTKVTMINRVSTGDETLDTLPIKGITPTHGELHWYLDGPAAGAPVEDTEPQ